MINKGIFRSQYEFLGGRHTITGSKHDPELVLSTKQGTVLACSSPAGLHCTQLFPFVVYFFNLLPAACRPGDLAKSVVKV